MVVGEWMGGKCVGNIQLIGGQRYYLRHNGHNLGSVSLSDFPSPDKAYTHAKRLLYDYCLSNSLLINQYRYVFHHTEQWLEVQVAHTCFLCDVESLALVEAYNWRLKTRNNFIIATGNVTFHHALFPDLPPYTKVIHIDENRLNNRTKNLKVCREKEVRVRNRGKYWGVVKGRDEVRCFSIRKYGAVEARKLAMDEASHLQDQLLSPK